MLQIIQNMMVSQGLELELSMARRTAFTIQHPLFMTWLKYLQKWSTPAPIIFHFNVAVLTGLL